MQKACLCGDNYVERGTDGAEGMRCLRCGELPYHVKSDGMGSFASVAPPSTPRYTCIEGGGLGAMFDGAFAQK